MAAESKFAGVFLPRSAAAELDSCFADYGTVVKWPGKGRILWSEQWKCSI